MASKIKRKYLQLDWSGDPAPLRAEDIPYDANKSIKDRLDEVDAGIKAFGHLFSSATQTASNSSWTDITFNNHVLSGIAHNNSVNPQNITLPYAGKYAITLALHTAGTSAGDTLMARGLIDGTEVQGSYIERSIDYADQVDTATVSFIASTTSTNQILKFQMRGVDIDNNARLYAKESIAGTPQTATVIVEYQGAVSATYGHLFSDQTQAASNSAWTDVTFNYHTISNIVHSTSTNPEVVTLPYIGNYRVTTSLHASTATVEDTLMARGVLDGSEIAGSYSERSIDYADQVDTVTQSFIIQTVSTNQVFKFQIRGVDSNNNARLYTNESTADLSQTISILIEFMD